MTVRFSTRCPNSDYLGFETSPEAIVAAATKAEEVGFDAIFVNDHIIQADSSQTWRRELVSTPLLSREIHDSLGCRLGCGWNIGYCAQRSSDGGTASTTPPNSVKPIAHSRASNGAN